MDNTKNTLYKLENYFKLGFIICCIISLPIRMYDQIVLGLGMFICFLGLKRQMRGIQFSKEYLSAAITKDFGAGFMYLLFMLTVTSPLRVFCLPMSLYFALGFAQFVKMNNVYIFQKIEKINNLLEYIRNNSINLKKSKLLMEFCLIPYSGVLIFFGGSFLTPFLLFNFLRIRMLNEGYKQVMTEFLSGIYGKLAGSTNPVFKMFGKLWGYIMKVLL